MGHQDGLDGLLGLAGDLRPEWLTSCRFGPLVIAKITDLFSGAHPDYSVRSVVTHIKAHNLRSTSGRTVVDNS